MQQLEQGENQSQDLGAGRRRPIYHGRPPTCLSNGTIFPSSPSPQVLERQICDTRFCGVSCVGMSKMVGSWEVLIHMSHIKLNSIGDFDQHDISPLIMRMTIPYNFSHQRIYQPPHVLDSVTPTSATLRTKHRRD